MNMNKLHIPELRKLIINNFYCGYCSLHPWCSLDKVIINNEKYIIRWYYDYWQWPYRTIEIENKWITNKWTFYTESNDIELFIYNLIWNIPALKEQKIAIEIEKIKTIMLWLTKMWIWEYERSQIALDLSECVAKLLNPETKLQRLLSFFKPKWK